MSEKILLVGLRKSIPLAMKTMETCFVPAAPLAGELRTTVATLAMQTIARRFVIFPWLVTFIAPGTHVVN